MPACKQMYNIFHPFDPVAFRFVYWPFFCTFSECINGPGSSFAFVILGLFRQSSKLIFDDSFLKGAAFFLVPCILHYHCFLL